MRPVHGPYKHGASWRIVYKDDTGRQRYQSYPSRSEAAAARLRMVNERDGLLAMLSQPVAFPEDPIWVYLLKDEAGAIIYVGSSRRPDRRRMDHRANRVPFATMWIYPEVFERAIGLAVESALIRQLDPYLNQQNRMQVLWNAGGHGFLDERSRDPEERKHYGHHYVSAPDSSSENPAIRNRKMIARSDENH